MRILLVSASAGAGHMRAADAIKEAANLFQPTWTVEHADILDFAGKAYKKAYAGSFLQMVNHAPALWGALYEASDELKEHKVRDRFARFYDKLQFASFREHVRDFAPDVLIATHFLPLQVFAPYREKGRDTFPIAVVITDFDVHAYWVQPHADRFFVASDEVKFILANRGIPKDHIAVSGIPISQQFVVPLDRAKMQEKFGIPKGNPAVLVMAGGAGVGAMTETVKAVLEGPPVSVMAVAGKNADLKAELEALPVPPESVLKVFGFVNPIAEPMSVADLVITKSGGLTTSECLAMGLPMLIRDPIPGQEERNADYVVEAGAGLRVNGPHSLRFKLHRLLADPERLTRMSAAAHRASRPQAARQIVEEIGRLNAKAQG